MKRNVGNIDRILRAGAALVILILSLTKVIEGPFAVFSGAAAVVLLLTSLTGLCPCYMRLNLNTFKKKE